MENIKDFYITGLPVKTSIGESNFLKVRDYAQFFLHLNAVRTSRLEIIYNYQKLPEFDKDILEYLKKLSLYEMVMNSAEVLVYYKELFGHMFNDPNIFEKIDKDNFEHIRKIVLEMNCIKEEYVNPNPKIQEWIEKSKQFYESEGEKISFEDIASSIAVYTGMSYMQINNLTLYQYYMTFQRITQFKNYDTTTLFATVSAEKIDIQSWCKHIDLSAEDRTGGMTREEYDKKRKNIGL